MQYFVYVLRSELFSRFYIGMSADVEKRLKEHNSGKTKSTKGYRPWKVILCEEYSSRIEARVREKYLKSGIGREWIKDKWSGSSAACLPTGRDTCLPAGREQQPSKLWVMRS